jgi:ferrous iron transport protein A
MKMQLENLTAIPGETEANSAPKREQSLAEAAHGIWHLIKTLVGPAEACDRLLDLGFTPDAEVKIAQIAPLGDPLVVVVRGTRLALRRDEASWIIVK